MNRFLAPLLPLIVIAAMAPSDATQIVSQGPSSIRALWRTHGGVLKGRGPIQHVVVVIQENRTMDDLFNGFCLNPAVCADTVSADPVSGTPLVPESIAAPFGLNHDHQTFVTQFDNGKMDGFNQTPINCKHACSYTAFDYVPMSETTLYRQLATLDGEMSDATFETEQGPSLPSHVYAISGQSGGYDDDRWALAGGEGNCATKKLGPQILMSSKYPGQMGNDVPPCKDFQTIFDLLASAGHSWRYYSDQPGGWWSATENIQHLYGSPNFIVKSNRFLTDVANGQLADVTFVIPFDGGVSDHPVHMRDPEGGGKWVSSVVDAVGDTPFWYSTAFVIFWDDWGGFFDHVVPPASPVQDDPFEYGFRVPLIVVSPYARVGHIDHTQRTFVSALRLIEEAFNLPSLGTTDQYEPDGLDSMFDFGKPPRRFIPIGGTDLRPFVKPPRG
jgi:phospholipase C